MTAAVPARPITTIDLLKTFAILIMVIDHMGFFFFTEVLDPPVVGDPNLWWRVVGRACVPIWFFLIGYARTREVPATFLLGGLFLEGVNLVTGMFVFPLNILFSMAIIRLMLDRVAWIAFGSMEGLAGITVVSLVLMPVTVGWTEYGTLGLLMALIGYARRHAEEKQGLFRYSGFFPFFFFVFGFMSCLGQFQLFPNLGPAQVQAMTLGMMLVYAVLFVVPFSEYPRLTAALPGWIVGSVQFMGWHTLAIYVVHLTLFKILALVFGLGYPIYGWFDWEWTIYDSFQHARDLKEAIG